MDLDKNELWDFYLNSFPEGTNPIFRERSCHDGSYDRHFVKNLGAVVVLERSGSIRTVWDAEGLPEPYATVASAMSDFVRQNKIKTIYRTKYPIYGSVTTYEDMGDYLHSWHHFFGKVPSRLVSLNAASISAQAASKFHVFKRGLDGITLDSIDIVLDLIMQNNLYRGQEHKEKVSAFKKLKNEYDGTDVYVWKNIKSPAAYIRNEVIGTLLTDMSSGIPLERAVASFESKVAPQCKGGNERWY